MLWNLTKIAASRDAKALDLLHAIMIASAAIPGAFPPMMIDVEADGQPFQEMHVDGGTGRAGLRLSTLAPCERSARTAPASARSASSATTAWIPTGRRWSIAGRPISSLIHTQGIGDLYSIYVTAQRDGADFNLAFIPASFNVPHREEFDTEYMRALFQTGFDMAAKGDPWHKVPPGY